MDSRQTGASHNTFHLYLVCDRQENKKKTAVDFQPLTASFDTEEGQSNHAQQEPGFNLCFSLVLYLKLFDSKETVKVYKMIIVRPSGWLLVHPSREKTSILQFSQML